jgi:hypothetical protein
MHIDWIRLVSIIESLIVVGLYLRTTFHGFQFAYRYKQNRPFNAGRGLSSLGVVITMGAFILLFINRWNSDPEPPYFALAFIANLLFLFGWIYSVRVTLKEGRPDY